MDEGDPTQGGSPAVLALSGGTTHRSGDMDAGQIWDPPPPTPPQKVKARKDAADAAEAGAD
jgi:hypothetical protein